MHYKHTQIGRLMIFIPIIIILYFVAILVYMGFDRILFGVMTILTLLLSSFVSLSVIINKRYLQVKFGYGIYKKRFKLENILSVKTVKNHWYYGRGIRVWFWPYMWIFNISGFDAVEIKMKNGRIYRIGTNEPKGLESAITKAIKG